MSATRNIIDLLLILLERQQIGGPELQGRFGVDGRTIRNYMTTLKEAGVPVTSTKGRYSKYQLQGKHGLLGFRFTPEDVEILTAAKDLLKIEKGYSFELQFQNLLQRVKEKAPLLITPTALPINNHTAMDPGRDKSIEMMNVISKALKEYRKLDIVYHSAGKDETTHRTIWPFGFHNFDDENYLLAHCELRKEIREFHIKRIVELNMLDSYYPKKERISVKEYFQNSIGAFGGEPFEIKLEIEHPFAQSELEKKRFKKQKITRLLNGDIELTATVAGRPNIVSWILGMGPNCTVLEPVSLKREIIKAAKEMVENYSDKPCEFLGMEKRKNKK